jgi:serine/threonine protein kinase
MVGRTFAHYRVTRALGHGGMGDVYLAEDTRLKRQVALKFLPSEVATDPIRLERFEHEAQVVAALNHPNIVTVHSIERDGETLFMAMEYLEGQTLAEIIPRGGLPLSRLLTLATQIVDALVAAHSHGVVHRDLKPSNVMVLAGDRVKVLDFGLAKLRDVPEAATLPTRELTGEGRIVGTVAYTSPEQAEGKPVDQRSDIFAIGVMLYEMTTGERPFRGDTSLSVLSSILRDTPRPVTELNPGLPRDAWRIVRHCLAKDPERRYQTAKDLRNDLDDLAQSLSSGELAATSAVPSGQRSPWPMRVTLAVALVCLLVAFIAWQLRGPESQANASPPTLSHSRLTQREGVEQWPSISPDGKWVVYEADGDIYLQSVSGQTPINLTKDSPSAETQPAFSPDGETIAFRSTRDGGGIFLMGRTGESVRRLTNGGFNPAWFPAGESIVYASSESTGGGPENRDTFSELWTVAVDAGEPRRLFAGDAVQPRVSPNGRRIAYWAGERGQGDARAQGAQRHHRQGVRITDHHQGRCHRREGNRSAGSAREHGRADGQGSRQQDVGCRRRRHHYRDGAGAGHRPRLRTFESRVLRVVLRQPLPAHGPHVLRIQVVPMASGQQQHHEGRAGEAEDEHGE